jgi:hypothetical protein
MADSFLQQIKRGLGIRQLQSAPGPRYVVMPESIPGLRQTESGRELLANAYNGNANPNPMLIPAESAAAGNTGIGVSVGRVTEEYNSELSDIQSRMTKFKEMRRSESAVGISELLITLPLSMTDFHVLPGEDEELAELLEWNIHDGLGQYQIGSNIPPRPFSSAIREASLAFFEGFAWQYQKTGDMTTGGKSFTGWHELAPRLPSTVQQWDFDSEGHAIGLVAYGMDPRTMESRYVYYARDEILLWSWCDDGGDPEGLGGLRRAYRAYCQKDDYQRYAGVRIKRQACGVPYAVAPEGEEIVQDQADAVVAFMRRIATANDSGGYIPYGWELKTFDMGDASVPFESHIQRQTEAIHDVFGTGFVVLSQGGSAGSNALSREGGAWFGECLLEGIADWICHRFNAEAIPDFARMNGSTAKRLPSLEHGKVAVRDLERYTRALKVWYKDQPGGVPPELAAEWQETMGVRPGASVGPEALPSAAPVVAMPEQPVGAGGNMQLPLAETGGGAQ